MAKKDTNRPLTVKDMEDLFIKFFNPNKIVNATELVTPPPMLNKKVVKLAKSKWVTHKKRSHKFGCSNCNAKFQTENGANMHTAKNGDCSTWKNHWNMGVANA
tara:strand:- start:1340 stop:1648 length:309 start_codon:yes stop_codon:yes gene_type:complete